MYYDRSGASITLDDWARLLSDPAAWRVARTTVWDAAKPAVTRDVSTVWLGLDHGFGNGLPVIFETMVFGDDSRDLACTRYCTEIAAREGHAEMVVCVAATMADPVIMDVYPVTADVEDT